MSNSVEIDTQAPLKIESKGPHGLDGLILNTGTQSVQLYGVKEIVISGDTTATIDTAGTLTVKVTDGGKQ